jgi:hypothetical protein
LYAHIGIPTKSLSLFSLSSLSLFLLLRERDRKKEREMNSPETRWLEWHHRLRERFSDEWFNDSGLSAERGIHELVGGYNHRTFPTDGRWTDQEGTIWRNAGLHVFDFKRSSKTAVPDGICILRRSWSGYTVTITCRVVRAFRSRPEVIADAVAVGRDRPVYSKNCGRAILYPLNIRVTGGSGSSGGGSDERIVPPMID